MKKQMLYGMLGFLSLLGFVGLFTEERSFLGFFAFAVDFQYFFLKSDEMLEEQLARSASRAFVAGMLVMAAAVLGMLALGRFDPSRALLTGCAAGLPLNWLLYESLVTAQWGSAWHFPIIPLLVILTVTAISVLLAIYGPTQRIRAMSVTETIGAQ